MEDVVKARGKGFNMDKIGCTGPMGAGPEKSGAFG